MKTRIYVPISDTSGDSCVNACTLLVDGLHGVTRVADGHAGHVREARAPAAAAAAVQEALRGAGAAVRFEQMKQVLLASAPSPEAADAADAAISDEYALVAAPLVRTGWWL